MRIKEHYIQLRHFSSESREEPKTKKSDHLRSDRSKKIPSIIGNSDAFSPELKLLSTRVKIIKLITVPEVFYFSCYILTAGKN